jgi:transposase
MTQSTPSTVGVDISKDHLDVAHHPSGAAKQFSNDAKGFRSLIAWLGPYAPERIIFEATGAYHRAFERSLGAEGLPLVKVNPMQARRFAEAIGKRAKTDQVDAAMLARFGDLLAPPIRPIVSETLNQMKELHAARTALVKDRTAALNRQKNLSITLLERQANERLRQIESQIAAIDAELTRLAGSDPDLKARLERLESIPGIGTTTALALIVEMPELGNLDSRQAASLAGLAPITRQSGQWKGKSFIGGGRAKLRQALYMPAIVAMRFNPDLKVTYDGLIARGKPPKLAITAIMRKLIVLANALIAQQRSWVPKIA